MRITIVYRYFWPDTPPYATMLKEISSWLASAGHDVRILSAQPAYKPDVRIDKQPSRENIDGVEIVRLPLLRENGNSVVKAINGGLFIGQATFCILFGKKQDLVWTATMPPVLQALMISIAGRLRGAKFLYHMQDIHPEISRVNNQKKNGLFGRLLIALDRYTLKRAQNAIVLSDDMRQAIIKRGVPSHIPRVLRNFSLGAQAGSVLASPPERGEAVRFVFAGNIGRFQNLDALVRAFENVQEENIELVLVGDGRAKTDLVKTVSERNISNISFREHMSAEAAFDFMCTAHVGVVSLNPGLYKYAFPSKVLTYMAANLPMLAMVEDESQLAKLLINENIGVSVAWSSGKKKLVSAIRLAAQEARDGTMRPVDAKLYYHPDVAKENWRNLIAEYETDQARET